MRKSAHESLSINGKALTPVLDDDPTEVNTPGYVCYLADRNPRATTGLSPIVYTRSYAF